mmetsp:Transcript_2517/g.5324  ORF Transcript_2517/g.5324 Transcript_2517/m.5324 type:complete len:81 (-) Transcript_2517:309-551(-)
MLIRFDFYFTAILKSKPCRTYKHPDSRTEGQTKKFCVPWEGYCLIFSFRKFIRNTIDESVSQRSNTGKYYELVSCYGTIQ